jgi:predicted permease
LGATFRLDLATALKTSVRDGGVRRSRARSALVAIQTALAVVLLVGTGLLGRSLYYVRTVHLGLDVGKLVSVINRDSAGDGRLRDVATLARTLPGVTGVALTSGALLDDMLGATHLFSRDGDTLRTVGSEVGYIAADPTFLDVVGTRLVRGRQFTPDDRYGALPVMIVNEELARRVWPGRNAIGECLRIDRMERACYTVVGIAENAHSFYVIEDPKPVFYVPLAQHPERETTRDVIAGGLVARTDASPGRLASQLRAALRDTATAFRNQWVNVPTELLDQQYQPWVVGARLFAALAALALVLAIIGLYGVLSYLVAIRRHELGLRLALGAERGQMLGLVVREGIRQIAVGAVAGVVIVSVTASRISSLLYGVSPRDPGVMLAALAVLAGCAFLAALVPARRAMTIDPMTAIRDE